MSFKEILDEVIKNDFCSNEQNVKLKQYRNSVEIFQYLKECENNASDKGGWIYYQLGMHYQFGYGVEGDKEKAQMYYEKSAKLGNAFAMNSLAIYYYLYKSRYVELLEAASEKGHLSAMFNLAQYYAEKENIVKAVKLYIRCKEKGVKNAIDKLEKYKDIEELLNENKNLKKLQSTSLEDCIKSIIAEYS
jgi:TPR repeat protein